MSFAKAVAFVLGKNVEGGAVNDLQDPGGETNHGIALNEHPELTAEQVAALSTDGAAQIIHDEYWLKIRGDVLPEPLHIPVLAAAVLAGPETAVKQLQQAAYVPVDGVLGPTSLHAISVADERDIVARFTGIELARLASLPGWIHDGKGWAIRCARAAVEAFAS
jgi:lysozyme family protein